MSSLANCYFPDMRPIADVHRSNIALLIQQEADSASGPHGAQARLARKLNKAPAQLRQWLLEPGSKNYRGIGGELAREIEQACGLPTGWLDVDHERTGAGAPADAGREFPNAPTHAGNVVVPHLAGYDNEPGPAGLVFPVAMLRELMHLSDQDRLGWIVNPTDSMGEVIPKGMIAFVDTSVKSVRGNGIYALRLFGDPSIMRVQVRGATELRVTGSNRFDDAIDLHGGQVESLQVGGLIVGYADRIKLI